MDLHAAFSFAGRAPLSKPRHRLDAATNLQHEWCPIIPAAIEQKPRARLMAAPHRKDRNARFDLAPRRALALVPLSLAAAVTTSASAQTTFSPFAIRTSSRSPRRRSRPPCRRRVTQHRVLSHTPAPAAAAPAPAAGPEARSPRAACRLRPRLPTARPKAPSTAGWPPSGRKRSPKGSARAPSLRASKASPSTRPSSRVTASRAFLRRASSTSRTSSRRRTASPTAGSDQEEPGDVRPGRQAVSACRPPSSRASGPSRATSARPHGQRAHPPSLATLAYDCRRGPMFRDELKAALRIIERGDMSPSEMVGSWAGEIGQTQFLPTRYLEHAIDYDNDGSIDLYRNPTDIIGTTANYMVHLGWRPGEPWIEECACRATCRGRNRISPSSIPAANGRPGASHA